MKPLWVAVGGFILALGIVLIVGGYIAGPNQGIPTPTMGNGTGGLHWYGPNLILFGATFSPIGVVILLYGVATKGKKEQTVPKPRTLGVAAVVVVLLFAFLVPISTITEGTIAVMNGCFGPHCTAVINSHNVTASITYIYFRIGGTWSNGSYNISL